MPTYQYECESCGHRFQRFQPMTEAPERECPECERPVRRLIGTGAGVIMKGSGRTSTSACSLQTTGATCCGLDEPCGKACSR
jgi:putative FmdB family regulatory protein